MDKQVRQQLIRVIAEYKPQRAILFGSAARGETDAASDIDLVLIKTTAKPFLARLKEFALMVPNGLPRVEAFIYTPDEFARMQEWDTPFMRQVLTEGQVIYEASA